MIKKICCNVFFRRLKNEPLFFKCLELKRTVQSIKTEFRQKLTGKELKI